MDNNQFTTQTPPAGPNIVEASSGGNNKMLWIVVAVIIVLIIGGVYFYLNSQKATTETQTAPQAQQENLEEGLNAVNIDNGESDFSPIDKDLQSL